MDGVVYFQPGELLVGAPNLPGRPALRPLQGDESVPLPDELSDYEELSAGCAEPPDPRPEAPSSTSSSQRQEPDVGSYVLTRGDIGGDGRLESVRVERVAPNSPPQVLVIRDDQVVGRGDLPVPALPCRGLVAEAEPDADPALLLVWTSRGADSTTVGITVFELPEDGE